MTLECPPGGWVPGPDPAHAGSWAMNHESGGSSPSVPNLDTDISTQFLRDLVGPSSPFTACPGAGSVDTKSAASPKSPTPTQYPLQMQSSAMGSSTPQTPVLTPYLGNVTIPATRPLTPNPLDDTTAPMCDDLNSVRSAAGSSDATAVVARGPDASFPVSDNTRARSDFSVVGSFLEFDEEVPEEPTGVVGGHAPAAGASHPSVAAKVAPSLLPPTLAFRTALAAVRVSVNPPSSRNESAQQVSDRLTSKSWTADDVLRRRSEHLIPRQDPFIAAAAVSVHATPHTEVKCSAAASSGDGMRLTLEVAAAAAAASSMMSRPTTAAAAAAPLAPAAAPAKAAAPAAASSATANTRTDFQAFMEHARNSFETSIESGIYKLADAMHVYIAEKENDFECNAEIGLFDSLVTAFAVTVLHLTEKCRYSFRADGVKTNVRDISKDFGFLMKILREIQSPYGRIRVVLDAVNCICVKVKSAAPDAKSESVVDCASYRMVWMFWVGCCVIDFACFDEKYPMDMNRFSSEVCNFRYFLVKDHERAAEKISAEMNSKEPKIARSGYEFHSNSTKDSARVFLAKIAQECKDRFQRAT